MSYYRFLDDLGEPYGQFEVWYRAPKDAAYAAGAVKEGADRECVGPVEPGWYWWACFPGCLPDGDPSGPFATEAEAIADAQEQS
jgi:hypothetical protein